MIPDSLFSIARDSSYVTKRTSVPLHDPSIVYVVVEGSVDLYAVEWQDGRAVSTKQFLFSIEAGQIMLALPQTVHNQTGLVADVLPGTKWLSIDFTALQVLLRTEAALGTYCSRLLNVWIQNITAAVVTEIAPRQAQQVDTDQETVVWKEGTFLSESIVWARPITHPVRCWGRDDIPPVPAMQAVPLLRTTWVASAQGNRLHTVPMQEFITDDECAPSLLFYHELIGIVIKRNKQSREVDEQVRIALRAEQDQAMIEQSLARFAAVADKEKQQRLMEGAVDHDPLLMCCRWVGEVLGITISPPKRLNSNKPEAIFEALGIRYRKVALRGRWWCEDNGPLLAFWDDGNPVALLPDKGAAYILRDPAHDDSSNVTPAIAARLKPFAYEMYRSLPHRPVDWKDIIRFMFTPRARQDASRALFIGLVIGLLGMGFPIATGVLVDKIIPVAESSQLFYMMILLLALAFAVFGCTVSQAVTWLRLSGTSDSSLHSAAWDRLLHMPVSFFRQYTAGDLAIRMGGVTTSFHIISNWLTGGMVSALFSLLQIGLLFSYQPTLAWLAVILVVVYMILFALISVRLRRYTNQETTQQGIVSGLLVQLVASIPKLRVAAAEKRAFHRWSHAFSIQRAFAYKLRESGNTLLIINTGYPLAASLALFWMVSASGIQMNPGAFVAFHAAFAILIGSVIGFCASSIPLFELIPTYKRLTPLLEEQPEIDDAQSDPGELSGEIEVSHVSFAYDTSGRLALDDVSLHIKAGEYVAIVGASGSGKSTLLRLLIGFEKPTNGAIYYDGKDISGLDLRAVRRQCGVVLQNGRVWAGDIAENIIGQSTDLSVEDAWTAAHAVGLDADISSLPMGMHTVLSEAGSTFSGGQRQRILLARAIVHKPTVLFLDEATSALDQISQEKITTMLQAMNSTRIVIAHRLSTIVHADRIIVMEKGKIVEQGTYEELLERGGVFAAMAQRQVI